MVERNNVPRLEKLGTPFLVSVLKFAIKHGKATEESLFISFIFSMSLTFEHMFK